MTSARTTRRKAKPPRNRDLGRIHLLVKQIGMTDEQYRAVLWTQAQVDSSAQLDACGRNELIRHLESRLPQQSQPKRKYPGRPHNVDTPRRAELTKIEALLTDAGRPWRYVEAMAKRMYKRERLEFCAGHQLAGIIAALEMDARKRLTKQMEAIFGDLWEPAAAYYASWLFGFDHIYRDVEKYTQVMSNVLRWWRGDLEAACAWPIDAHRPKCCHGCDWRTRLKASLTT